MIVNPFTKEAYLGRRIERHLDDLFDDFTQEAFLEGFNERQTHALIQQHLGIEVADMYEEWLDESDPADRDGSMLEAVAE